MEVTKEVTVIITEQDAQRLAPIIMRRLQQEVLDLRNPRMSGTEAIVEALKDAEITQEVTIEVEPPEFDEP